jgi:hypothetical protein
MPWYQTWGGNFVDKTSKEEWTKCMNDSRVITLEDLSAGWGTSTAILSPKSALPAADAIYNLQGHRLAKIPSKGLYILRSAEGRLQGKNGKKLFAK